MDEQVVFLTLFLSSRGEMSAHRERGVQGMQHSGAPCISGKRRAHPDRAHTLLRAGAAEVLLPCRSLAASLKKWRNLVVPEPKGCCVAAISSPQQREG